jgi:hypothetical protein
MNTTEGGWRIDGRRCEPLDLRIVEEYSEECDQRLDDALYMVCLLVAFVAFCVLALLGWLPGGV